MDSCPSVNPRGKGDGEAGVDLYLKKEILETFSLGIRFSLSVTIAGTITWGQGLCVIEVLKS